MDRLPKVSETKYRDSIIASARNFGWLCYFTWNAWHSPAGFPDLCLCHPELKRLVFAELKLDGKEPTEKQNEWLQGLAKVDGIEVYIWHLPADLDEIAEVLTGLKVKVH
jgi:hypothetical protein